MPSAKTIAQAAVEGVKAHGDDFALSVDRTAPGEGVGSLAPTRYL